MSATSAIIILLFTTCYVLLLDYISVSDRTLLRSLVLPVALLLLLLFYASHKLHKQFFLKHLRWIILFWGTIFVQLLVLSTGGFQSPFLILIHLFMLGLGFLFSFQISVLFLLAAFVGLFIDLSFINSIKDVILENPTTIVLQVVSLLTIVPISYIVSRQYHATELLSRMLGAKVKAHEKILESLNELIIVTDHSFHILSVNDAVEHALMRPRTELINSPLFDVLFMKDSQGKVATSETFFQKGKDKEPTAMQESFKLLRSTFPNKTFHIQIQPVEDTQGAVNQINFILTDTRTTETSDKAVSRVIDKARARYEAMTANFKKQLRAKDISGQMLVLEEIENDIYHAQAMPALLPPTPIDAAKLCEKLVTLEKDFAEVFSVKLDFTIKDFGWKDIEPLTVKNYPVTPEQLTGPFFTISHDVKLLNLLIKKLLHTAILLSSKSESQKVSLAISRNKTDGVIIELTATCAASSETTIQNLLHGQPLPAGSGLETVLIKRICTILGVTVIPSYTEDPIPSCTFTLPLPKKATSGQEQ